jgi:hypothetical protein
MPTEYPKLSINGLMQLAYTDQIIIKRVVHQSQTLVATTSTATSVKTRVVYTAILFEYKNNKIKKQQLVLFDDANNTIKNTQLNYITTKCKKNQ